MLLSHTERSMGDHYKHSKPDTVFRVPLMHYKSVYDVEVFSVGTTAAAAATGGRSASNSGGGNADV
jgi:hypothetical protein